MSGVATLIAGFFTGMPLAFLIFLGIPMSVAVAVGVTWVLALRGGSPSPLGVASNPDAPPADAELRRLLGLVLLGLDEVEALHPLKGMKYDYSQIGEDTARGLRELENIRLEHLYPGLRQALRRFVAALDARRMKGRAETSDIFLPARAVLHEAVRDYLRPPAAPVVPNPPIGEGWLEGELIAAGFDAGEVHRDVADCSRSLARAGIITERAALAFIADHDTRAELQQIYRDELRNKTRILDPDGFCYWGPRLHQAAPEDKDLIRLRLRAEIRAFLDPGTGQEKTREVQACEELAARKAALARLSAAPARAEEPVTFGPPEQHGGRADLSWWCVHVTGERRIEEARIFIIYDHIDHPTLWQPELGSMDGDPKPDVLTLEPRQPVLVAVAIRSLKRKRQLLPYTAQLCTRPFYGISMVMAEDPLTPEPGLHELGLCVKSANGDWRSATYWLSVPETMEGNRGFVLSEKELPAPALPTDPKVQIVRTLEGLLAKVVPPPIQLPTAWADDDAWDDVGNAVRDFYESVLNVRDLVEANEGRIESGCVRAVAEYVTAAFPVGAPIQRLREGPTITNESRARAARAMADWLAEFEDKRQQLMDCIRIAYRWARDHG